MTKGCSHSLQMQLRTQCGCADWCIDDIVQYLRRRSYHYDLVLEKGAIGVIRLPQFGIENFIEPVLFERVRRGETNHVAVKIARHIISVADFSQSAGGKRFINLCARMRRQAREFQIRHAITHSANFSVDHIRPEIHESDTVIQELGRRGFSPLATKQIFKALLATPRRRNERRTRKEMTDKNQASPKETNQRQHE